MTMDEAALENEDPFGADPEGKSTDMLFFLILLITTFHAEIGCCSREIRLDPGRYRAKKKVS